MKTIAEDSSVRLPASFDRLVLPLIVGGLVLLVAGVILGVASSSVGARFAMGAYLTAFTYCLTICLGSLFFVIIQHLCRAGWSVTVRRLAELLMSTMPWLAILFLPILATLFIGNGTLYNWDDPEWVQSHHPDWESKAVYLSDWFFTLRALLYWGVWCGLTWYFFRASVRQDSTAELRLTEKMQAFSGPAVILFSLTVTFATFDWLMSIDAIWFSTMYGVYLFAGSVLSSLCAIAVMLYLLQRAGAMRQQVTVEHYHDFGKLIFGFLVFWTYIAFSQYLLIWYANIPEETFWFGFRQDNGWAIVSLMLVLLHWLVPFLGLLSRHVRRRPTMMFGWSLYLLVMHFIDVYWMIMPSVNPDGPLGGTGGVLTTLLCAIGMISVFIGAALYPARRSSLIPIRDPRLHESLAFHNN